MAWQRVPEFLRKRVIAAGKTAGELVALNDKSDGWQLEKDKITRFLNDGDVRAHFPKLVEVARRVLAEAWDKFDNGEWVNERWTEDDRKELQECCPRDAIPELGKRSRGLRISDASAELLFGGLDEVDWAF